MMVDRRKFVVVSVLLSLCLVGQNGKGQAQKPSARVFTLEEAVDFALTNYPAVRASLDRLSAARGEVALARTSYLPRTDMLWQSNRATRNNIFGLLLPQSIISPLTGPVLPSTSDDSVWGSAGGVLFSWEPFDFGYRHATVSVAQATQGRATAEVKFTRLDVAVATTDAVLTLLADEQRVRASRADVERRQVLAKSIHTLVDNQLRPGADASRADAELAAAKTQLIQAEEVEEVSRATLATILGIAGTEVEVDPGPLLNLPPSNELPEYPLSSHPVAAVQRALVDEVHARVHVLDRSYYPKFDLQSAVSGRGSGADADGTVASGLHGLGLQRSNWAAGLTVTFPLFDFASIHARKRIAMGTERAEQARYDQTIQDLTGQVEKGRAILHGARQVAENTPIELKAARDTETQARARYEAGLATIVEVADAQRLLAQAEVDDALARLNIWRALAQVAAAQGDLQPFMEILHRKAMGGP